MLAGQGTAQDPDDEEANNNHNRGARRSGRLQTSKASMNHYSHMGFDSYEGGASNLGVNGLP